MMLAALFRSAELAINEDEAKQLADAMQNVASYYNVGATAKQIAWVNLATTAGFVYGPRIVTMYRNNPPKPKPAKPFEMPKPGARAAAANGQTNDAYFDGTAPGE